MINDKSRKTRCVIIVGAMKAGTSSLFAALAKHPQICPCSEKEPQFFSGAYQWGKGWSWYEGLFQDFDPELHRYRLEASTDYSKFPYFDFTLDRMRSNKDYEFKFIYLLRHPFERIQSHHSHTAFTGHELSQIRPDSVDFSLNNGISEVAIQITRYAYHLKAYEEVFGKGSILPVIFEQLKNDPEVEMSRIFAFLGLPPDRRTAILPRENERSGKYANPLWGKMRTISSLKRLVHFLIPKTMRHYLYQNMRKKNNQLSEGRYRLNSHEHKQIETALADDLKALNEEYKINTMELWGIE